MASKPIAKKAIYVARDFLVIRPCDELSHTKGVIVMPDSGKDPHNPECGIVIGIGSGLIEGGNEITLIEEIGDHVRFPKNSGTLCKNDPDWGETVFVLRENQIFWSER